MNNSEIDPLLNQGSEQFDKLRSIVSNTIKEEELIINIFFNHSKIQRL